MYFHDIKAFTLVEALLAWTLLVIGCVGCSFGQLRAMQSMQVLEQHTQALNQIQNVLTITQNDHSHLLKTQWQAETDRLMPGSHSRIVCHASSCCAHIDWPVGHGVVRCLADLS